LTVAPEMVLVPAMLLKGAAQVRHNEGSLGCHVAHFSLQTAQTLISDPVPVTSLEKLESK